MRKLIALLVLSLVGCQAEPELNVRDFEPSREFVWRPQGHSYVFICEENATGMRCVAKSFSDQFRQKYASL